MTAPRRAVILRNPAARRAPSAARLVAAARRVEQRASNDAPWTIEVRDAASREEMVAAAGGAVTDGYDAVLATGGDGTLNVVLNGVRAALADRRNSGGPAVGLIPSGTGNVWALEAGIPRRIEDAVAMLLHGDRRRADLGLAQIGKEPPRRFLLMCGIGLDAGVVRLVDERPRMKRRVGRAAFVLPALTSIGRSRPVPTEIDVNDRRSTVPLRQALAGNSRLYAGVLRLANEARIDDGALDLVTFSAPGGVLGDARSLGLALRAVRGGLSSARNAGIDYRRAERVVLRPTAPLPVQLDGDFHGIATAEAPLALSVEPAAVTLIVGERARSLFAARPAAEDATRPA